MFFQGVDSFADRTALSLGDSAWTYQQLDAAAGAVAGALLDGADDLREARVAFLAPPGFEYVAAQWGIWRAGGVAAPLGLMHPPAEIEYALDDMQAAAVIVHPDYFDRVAPLAQARGLQLLTIDQALQATPQTGPEMTGDRRAMILYTSGTTSRPKGVVTTHAHISAQIDALVEAWEWTADDRILHVLPLHHIHGIINVLGCALRTGACCEMLSPFDADAVLDRFADGDLTLFMAVPTIYSRLIAAFEKRDAVSQAAVSAGCGRMRLMVSGSAALPVSVLEKWREISGHTLLERYGMTEIGMALSNPYHGTRRPGHVGRPLPRVEIRRVDESGALLADDATPGEIEARGPNVFEEYWNRPEATTAAFHDGWFRTGDVAVIDNGDYRLLGRNSVDIIKTGGYKVSALEIEEVLRTHPQIRECAVVGVPDEEWGECVAACIVADGPLELAELRAWGKELLAVYKVPLRLLCVDQLPRNAMGKVQKPAVKSLMESP
ncbi:Long-chain-fatty-acid--CoA ligase [Lignipirellula cremea]|uniref:Long-chain-fatty-acid--CoA ligase n=2 Tax=Lignipirellula cremea TaxID=2528010 RepID=A0A518DPY0_9BACT|nr:Long-chain-fatty-acid--CoA ligase [Lignipirellula cremea]